MLYEVQINKCGNLKERNWNSESLDYVDNAIEMEDVAYNLKRKICLGAGVSLGDIFALFNRDIIFFSAITGCSFLSDMIEDAFSLGGENKNIHYLELKRSVVLDNELLWELDFVGKGEKDYDLMFCALHEIVNCPIVLNENINIIDYKTNEIVLKTKKPFTLYELITGIVNELSFWGPPDIRDFSYQSLMKENVEAVISNKADDVKVACRKCGKDARSQDFDKPNNICGECFKKIKEN